MVLVDLGQYQSTRKRCAVETRYTEGEMSKTRVLLCLAQGFAVGWLGKLMGINGLNHVWFVIVVAVILVSQRYLSMEEV